MKQRNRNFLGLGGIAAFLLTAVASVSALDWPQYRGPSRDGRSGETGLLKAWPAEGPKLLWRVPLGDGYSGIAVAGGRLYTLFGAEGGEWLGAFDPASGKSLWRTRLGENWKDEMGNGPRSTPTVDGDAVFGLGSRGRLVALEAASGKERWSVDLAAAFGAQIPQWGVSNSPLVEGDLVMLDAGGRPGHSLLAFDKKTGKLAWASQTDRPGYSSPLAVTAAGVRQVLFFTGSALVSVEPATGKALWRYPWTTDYDVNAAMPIAVPDDQIFISSGYGHGAVMLKVKKQGAGLGVEEVWKSTVMKNHFNSSVLVAGYLYGFDDGTFKCVDAATGAEQWKQRGFGKGSLAYADGNLYVLSDQGALALVEAKPSSYSEKGRVALFSSRTWTMPTLAQGQVFLRDQKELLALKVGA